MKLASTEIYRAGKHFLITGPGIKRYYQDIFIQEKIFKKENYSAIYFGRGYFGLRISQQKLENL